MSPRALTLERRSGSSPSLTLVRPWEKNNKVEIQEPGVFTQGSPIPGVLQARTLEWGAISFSNAGK